MTDVQDLKCGDIFVFRNERYIVLSSISDNRHTTTHITAINGDLIINWLMPKANSITSVQITVLSLFRTFEVEVIGHDDSFVIESLRNNHEEITQEQQLKLTVMLQKERNL